MMEEESDSEPDQLWYSSTDPLIRDLERGRGGEKGKNEEVEGEEHECYQCCIHEMVHNSRLILL